MTRFSLLLPLVCSFAPAQEPSSSATHVPPAAGEVAKPLEAVNWYDAGAAGSVPDLVDLRGEVVLVHTWGYYCGPCVRKSVPYVVDLMRANRSRGLRAYSLTVPINDGQPDDHFVQVGREMGMEHPLGLADGFGAMTPYLNMNVSKGLTWCFVIGREGGVRWAGDPSIDDEELLEAVRAALAEEPAPPLDEGAPESLAEAVAEYVGGDLVRARDEAEKAAAKASRGRVRPGDEAVKAYAAGLIERIDAHRDELVQRLEDAARARDAWAFVAARRTLLARFEKSDAADRAGELERETKDDDAFAGALEAEERWAELARERPALFPVRDDKACARYAKALRKYVDRAADGAPGVERARELLAEHERAIADE